MGVQRKVHSAGFKAKVALAAHKADRTVNQLAGQYDVHPTQIHAWKKQLLAGAEAIFAHGAKVIAADAGAREAELYEQIGRLKMELEWMKKKVPTGRQSVRTSLRRLASLVSQALSPAIRPPRTDWRPAGNFYNGPRKS